jgi:hypothetical protein
MRRQEEGVGLDQLGAHGLRHRAFLDDAAPPDVAGVAWRGRRENARPHGGMQAVGADQEVAVNFGAVGEDCGGAVFVLSKILELHARPVAGIRQLPP